ncbi:InlB B-repeat-containing protein [Bifidobacterium sp. ESL0732]|uniref:InlB B-repeat-containing protein n=1 Tax=Bifidobacterium sp. ESL0732 TaxID=2983222 RepID=UPI0023F8DA31|nr:InlB B-repeat-containing protein [Bifidobacterium sp. ESL0732]WEV63637.1 InlB B-repeat-containing protein [Bifidobacterium sp. ESL0732]
MSLVKSLIGAVLAPVMLLGLAPPAANAVSPNDDTAATQTTQSQSANVAEDSNSAPSAGTPSSNEAGVSSPSSPTDSSSTSQQTQTTGPASSTVSNPGPGTSASNVKGQAANGSSGLTAKSASSPVSDNRNGSITQAKPSVGAQDAVPCTAKTNQVWGALHWSIHLSDDQQDCVLELEGGTIPDTHSIGDQASNPINQQYKSTEVTKLVVDKNDANPVKLTNGWGIFDGYFLPNLKTADVDNLDTSGSTNMGYMFHIQSHLTSITGMDKWDTSKVTDMQYMFQGDTVLVGDVDTSPQAAPNGRNLDLSNWKTSAVKNMTGMFQNCSALQSLDISGFDMNGLSWVWLGSDEGPGGQAILRNYYSMFAGMNLKRVKLGQGAHIVTDYSSNSEVYYSVYGSKGVFSYDCAGNGHEFDDACLATTPRYETVDQSAVFKGWHGINPGPAGPDGKGEWLYLTTAHYNGNGAGSSVTPCGDGNAVPFAPVCTAATRPGYRLKGWNTQANMQGTDYLLKDGNGNVPVIPYDLGNVTLYARWTDKPQPTITGHTVKSDGVHVSGSSLGTLRTGDKVTVSDGDGQSSPAVAVTTGSSWEAVVPLPKDLVGRGGDVTYTATITGENADPSDAYTATIDAVAPGFEDLKVDSSARTLTGTVWSSGDKTAQTGRTVESGDTVDVTWPDETTSTSASGADGKFSVPVPASVPMSGKAKVKATDAAGANGVEGRSNGSDPVEVKMSNTVRFDVGPGAVTDAPVDQNVADGGHAIAPTIDPSKTGYRFDGWYTDDNYGTKFDFGGIAINEDKTIYAKWTRLYKVSFDLGSGAMAGTGNASTVDQQVADGGHAAKPSTNPAPPTGYRFGGWYTDNTYATKFNFDDMAITADTTIYAKWVKTWQVVFDANGGGAVANPTVTLDDGQKVGDPGAPNPAPADGDGNPSVFRGWYNGTTKYDFNDVVTGDLNLKAKWADANHTVTFDPNQGQGAPDAVRVADHGKVTRPAASKNPTREGYRFDDWYTDATGSTKFDFSTTEITGNATVYAHWVKTYKVTFAPAGGSDVDGQTIDAGGTATDPGAPATAPTDAHGESSRFLGWFESGSATPYDFSATSVGADVTLTAHWDDLHREVRFDTQGGPSVGHRLKDDGGTPGAAPADPEWARHRFLGWFDAPTGGSPFDFGQTLHGDVTAYAHWTGTWDVTFDANGGDDVAKQEINSGGTATDTGAPSTPPTDRHGESSRFLGWFADGSETAYDFSTAVTGDVALKAKWDDAHREVKFDSHGGSNVAHRLVNDGATPGAAPATPTRANYRFLGWFTAEDGGTEFDFGQALHRDVTAHARWVRRYTVTFDANGGSAVDAKTVDAGRPVLKPADPTKRDSHGEPARFLGWYEPGSETAYVFASTPVSADVTLTARWDDLHRKVSFDSHGGSAVDSQLKVDGQSPDVVADPSKTGYRFVGWFTAADGGTTFSFGQVLHGDVTAHARWVKTWTVSFDTGLGGSVVPSQTRDEGSSAVSVTDPTTSATDSHGDLSKFLGWFVDGADTAYDFSKPLTADVSLKARWGDARHKITLNLGNGEADTVSWVDDGGLLIRPVTDPVKTGYRFDGWYTVAPSQASRIRLRGAGTYDFSVAPTGDFTLYAHYVKTWNVTFDANGGTGQPVAQVVDDGAKATAPAAGSVSRDGYVLNGWKDANGRAYDFDSAVTGDVSLKASWKVDKSALNALIDKAKGKDKSDYTPESFKPLQDALDHAKDVSKDPDASKSDVDQAAASLQDALNSLKPVDSGSNGSNGSNGSGANGSNSNGSNGSNGSGGLDGLIDQAVAQAGNHRQSDYTPDSWEAFQNALDRARAVARDPHASKADIDQATAALRNALNGLKLRGGLSATGAGVVAPAVLASVLAAFAGITLVLRKREKR